MLNAKIISRLEVTPDLIILGVSPDSGVPDFLPGQYVALGLPATAARPESFPPLREVTEGDKLIKRAYSIGSSPLNKDYLEFYLAIVRDGSLTSRLVLLKEGDRLFAAAKPVGTFTLADVPGAHNLVLVATGTGLAPYMAMLRTPSTWSSGRRITVIHGVRYRQDLAYREELERFERSNPGILRYIPVVSRPDSEWNGVVGYVQHLFRPGGLNGTSVVLNPTLDHVYLCGNPAMVEEAEQQLCNSGYTVHSKKTPGKLHLEKYW